MFHIVRANGSGFNVYVAGEGPVVLLVHGFPLDHTMWREQLPVLERHHRVVAPDLRGFGRSDVTPGTVRMVDFADDLAAILEGLSIDEPVTYCGLSMGGYIGWPFWQRHRELVEAFVLCDTRASADTPEVARGRRLTAATVLREGGSTLSAGMIPKLFAAETRREQPAVIEACRKLIEGTNAEAIAAALLGMAERPDNRELLPSIDVPALVICGSEDGLTPPAEMRAMAAEMPAASYIEIAGAGHMSPWEKPREFNAALTEFLAS